MESNIYSPIKNKIKHWLEYEKNAPIITYWQDKKGHDKYRANNDLDCKLNDNKLSADTIFSLWIPLRLTILRLNDDNYSKIESITHVKLKKKNKEFLESLLKEGILEKLLPIDNNTTKLLSDLFKYGQKKENTMILPERYINSRRGKKPYYDYMPYFLYECFEGGAFSEAFENNNEKAINWIKNQKLEGFFDGEIRKENIRDLTKKGNVKDNLPDNIDDLNFMLKSYVDILKNRKI